MQITPRPGPRLSRLCHAIPILSHSARCLTSTCVDFRPPEQAVVEEFSPATASILGLPWDYHEKCRASLEADYLQPIYLHARSVARESAPAALVQQDGGTCQACLALMSAILSWDFRCAAFQARAPHHADALMLP